MKLLVARAPLAALAAAALLSTIATAEALEVRLAQQFGVSYLPLTVMQQQELLEKHGAERGIELTTHWVQFSSGTPMNEALISGNLDFASGGVGPLLTIWSRTQGNMDVKGVAAINAMPLYLNTSNPDVQSLADFTDNDRIALPAVGTSIQAITLQMAAEQEFGEGQEGRLDHLTVSMSHPDGHAALMSGGTEITGHFTSAPFMYQQLESDSISRVVNSYDVLGGPHTFNSVWATRAFAEANPQVMEAFIAALEEAMEFINANPAEAAQLWIDAEGSSLSAETVEAIIRDEENEWTMTPQQIMSYAEFMYRTGKLDVMPDDWSDVYFEYIHNLPGN